MIDFLQHGLFNVPWWGYIIYTLILTQITILSVTIFLHRHQAHRALDLHPAISHFFRFWLWLTTGMITKEWAAIHRKHHAFSDKKGDPHSPKVFGIKKVFFEGAELYQEESRNAETLQKYGNGTPDDWLERNVYTKHSKFGILIMLFINLICFGPIGLSIWAIQMIWIPLHAAGVINGIGHFWGYRNFANSDNSRNIFPIGFWIGGEELHGNHHTFGTSAKFSYKWYEFDIGWMWIRIFEICGLAKVKKIRPVLNRAKTPKLVPDGETLETIISNRYNLMMRYAKLLKHDCKRELVKFKNNISWRQLRFVLAKDHDSWTIEEKSLLENITKRSQALNVMLNFRIELGKLWTRSSLTNEELVLALQKWCKEAEESGIKQLQLFSLRLRASY